MVTDIKKLDLDKKYSYADYITWKFKERVELIKGKVFTMSPAPSRIHQEISSFFHGELYQLLKKSSCHLFAAPFDVKLSNKDDATVVQPDICVICDKSKLKDFGCEGAPDLIIEILSPGNSHKEMKDKFLLYEENMVKEYWLVSPQEKSILIYSFQEGRYIGSKPFVSGETAVSVCFNEFKVNLDEVFKE
ncbi:MAG: Uma2 family endonuclease [Bacteroidota bacterium]